MNQTKVSSLVNPLAFIYSDIDDLSFSICKKFVEKNCLVKIICSDVNPWKQVIIKEHLPGVEVYRKPESLKDLNPNYIIYQLNSFKVSGNKISRTIKDETKNISKVINITQTSRAKTAFLFPAYEKVGAWARGLFEKLERNIKYEPGISIIYFDQTIGPYFRPFIEDPFGRMINQFLRGGPVDVPEQGASFSLASSDKVAEVVLKIVLSFGKWQEVYLAGPKIHYRDFFFTLRLLDENLISRETPRVYPVDFSAKQRLVVESPRDEEILMALRPLKKQENKGTIGNKINDDTKKSILYFVFSVCLFLLLPYFVLFTGMGFLYAAVLLVQNQNPRLAQSAIVISEKTATISKQGFSVLSGLPWGERIFGSGLGFSDVLEKASGVGSHTLLLLNKGEELANNFFSESVYDSTLATNEITLEFDYIYTELGFLQGEIAQLSVQLPYLLDWENLAENISKARNKIYFAKGVAAELPWLLGEGEKRLYLVLFQNNMELRPTGGYIGSFALVTVENGQLVDIEVQDVFTADGQLKGHVEPPEPIKKYLGEAGWFLRDSNWDPEFSVSAQRAEWFLDKELGVQVDGVIALDLEAVKKILEVTGEIELSDFSKTISSQNLFEETRKQIEENFFPGSRVKASFLTALSSSLLDKISVPGESSKIKLARAIALGLEERNIQVFLHNPKALKSLELLGWAGGLASPQCGQTCIPDWVGLAEANLGVNKANYYIERKVNFSVSIGEEKIDRTLTITWRNKAPKDIGEKGRYEVYIRVLAPSSGKFGYGQKRIGLATLGFSPDLENVRGHEEAGTIIEVFPGESSTASFNWTTPVELNVDSGEYVLYVRKQAGTQADPWEIKIDNTFGKKIKAAPVFSLTGVNQFGYNTLLARDFVSRVWW